MPNLTSDTRRVVTDFRHIFHDPELKGLVFFAAIILTVGSVFYMIVEDWDIIQSFYFSVTTLTTVGFGDLHPTNDVSRLFTTAYTLLGIGFILGVVNVVARQASRSVADRLNHHNIVVDRKTYED
jgi:voltage-gated potassium channel